MPHTHTKTMNEKAQLELEAQRVQQENDALRRRLDEATNILLNANPRHDYVKAALAVLRGED